MNTQSLTVNVPGRAPSTSYSPSGQPIVLHYDIDNGEEEGYGVHLVVTLTSTLMGLVQQWVVRAEQNGGDHVPALNVVSVIHAPTVVSGGQKLMCDLRGESIRRTLKAGSDIFKNNQCTPAPTAEFLTDSTQIEVLEGGATENGGSVWKA